MAETLCPVATLVSTELKPTRSRKEPAYINAHSQSDTSPEKVNPTVQAATSNATFKSCVVCKGSCASVEKCDRFKELGYNSKWATVKELNLCRRCLKKHRGTCKSQQVCGKDGCLYKHHQLLHNNQRGSRETIGSTQVTRAAPAIHATERDCNTHLKHFNRALFRVVPVILYGPVKKLKTYAFLDDGSSLTLMDSSLATELNLEGKNEPLCLRWTSNNSRMETDSQRLTVKISGTGEKSKKYHLQEVHTISSLDLFHQSVNVKELANQYPYLHGIPAESYEEVQPRILIGIDNANLIYPLKGKEGEIGRAHV